jgi:hypothetical protein
VLRLAHTDDSGIAHSPQSTLECILLWTVACITVSNQWVNLWTFVALTLATHGRHAGTVTTIKHDSRAGAPPSTPQDVYVGISHPLRRHQRPFHEVWWVVRENGAPIGPATVSIVSRYAPSRGPIIVHPSHGRSALTSSAPPHHRWAHIAFN